MKARSLAIVLALFVVPQVARAQPIALSGDDLRAISYLHSINRVEIYVGGIAAQRGSRVRDLGYALVDDHTISDARLIAYARKHGIETIPVESPIDADHRRVADSIDKFRSLSGNEFDDAFLNVMPAVFESEQQTIEDGIATVDDPELEQILWDIDGAKRSHVTASSNLENTTGYPQWRGPYSYPPGYPPRS